MTSRSQMRTGSTPASARKDNRPGDLRPCGPGPVESVGCHCFWKCTSETGARAGTRRFVRRCTSYIVRGTIMALIAPIIAGTVSGAWTQIRATDPPDAGAEGDNRGLQGTAQLAPTLTVGLPVFNGAKFIEASVESILSQSFSDLELIISDNASTDDTEAVSRSIPAGTRGLPTTGTRRTSVSQRTSTCSSRLRAEGYSSGPPPTICCDPVIWNGVFRFWTPTHRSSWLYTKTEFVDENGAPLRLTDPGLAPGIG